MKVFISNGKYYSENALSSVSRFINSGFKNIEISCGYVETGDLKKFKDMKTSGINIRLHNYFPNLGCEFVMNLASSNKQIRDLTKNLILNAIRWSHELESGYYAFHAGFLIDLNANELDGKAGHRKVPNRAEAIDRFKNELAHLKTYADSLGVELAVENNVYDRANFKKFGNELPFLAVCDEDIKDILIDGIGLLLDFGHLNVSSKSLSIDRSDLIKKWWPHVSGFHLSDNNGEVDQNMEFDPSSWFMQYLEDSLLPTTIEVYTDDFSKLKKIEAFL